MVTQLVWEVAAKISLDLTSHIPHISPFPKPESLWEELKYVSYLITNIWRNWAWSIDL
jgi:hypothetical protein